MATHTISTPTFTGYVSTTHDALIIFECVRRGIMPKIPRRLRDDERQLIRSGSVFVFDEKQSGIKRWTDGLLWSPSRILWNFLVYRQIDKKSSKTPDGVSISTPNQNPLPSLNIDMLYDPLANGVGPVESGSAPSSTLASPHQGGSLHMRPSDETRGRSVSSASDSAAGWYGADTSMDVRYSGMAAQPFPQGSQTPVSRKEADLERSLVGSLKNSYPFAKDGLCKKTISIQVDGSTQHLVSYYKVDDVRNGRLNTPLSLPEIAAVNISPMILQKSNFRNPPDIEVMPDGSLRYRGDGSESSRRNGGGGVGSGSEGTSGSEGRGGGKMGSLGPRSGGGVLGLGHDGSIHDGTQSWYGLPPSGGQLSPMSADISLGGPGFESRLSIGPGRPIDGLSAVNQGSAAGIPRRLSGTFVRDRNNRAGGRYEPYTRAHLNPDVASAAPSSAGGLWPQQPSTSSPSGPTRHRYTFSGRDNAGGYPVQVDQADPAQRAPTAIPNDFRGIPDSLMEPKQDTSSPASRSQASLWPAHPNSPFGSTLGEVPLVGNPTASGFSPMDPLTRPRGATTGAWHPAANSARYYGMALPLASQSGIGLDLQHSNGSSSDLPAMLGSSIQHQQQVNSRSVHLESLATSAGLPTTAPNYEPVISYAGEHSPRVQVPVDGDGSFQQWNSGSSSGQPQVNYSPSQMSGSVTSQFGARPQEPVMPLTRENDYPLDLQSQPQLAKHDLSQRFHTRAAVQQQHHHPQLAPHDVEGTASGFQMANAWHHNGQSRHMNHLVPTLAHRDDSLQAPHQHLPYRTPGGV
ncbi:unnamed protein product [Parajaminaea phylloscopi]